MKTLFLLFFSLLFLVGCGKENDTENNTDPTQEEQPNTVLLRIVSVNLNAEEITFRNFGETRLALDSYFLCTNAESCSQISGLTSSSATIEPNDIFTVSYAPNPMNAGVALFTENSFDTADPAILIDYVQWGAASQAFSDQAVLASRWNDAATFIIGASPYRFIGVVTDVGSSFWIAE